MKTTGKFLHPISLSISVLALLFTRPLEAATVTLNPSADAFVSANASTSNYGGAGALAVSAAGSSQEEFQSVMQFNLSSAVSAFNTQFGAGQWNLQSITLTFNATAPNNPIFNANAAGQFGVSWMQNDSWTEGTGTPQTPGVTGITYATLSGFTGGGDENLGTFNFAGGNSGSANYSLTLAPGFSADALAGNLISFRLFAADSAVSYLFDSRTFNTASLRPTITVTAVPEPDAASLAGIAAIWLLVGRRFRPNLFR